jgi:hypothetical protein
MNRFVMAAKDSIVEPVFVIQLRIVNHAVETPRLLALQAALHDKFSHQGDIAQFDKVRGQQVIPEMLGYFNEHGLEAQFDKLQPSFIPDNANIIPHEASYLVPVMADQDTFVNLFCLTG